MKNYEFHMFKSVGKDRQLFLSEEQKLKFKQKKYRGLGDTTGSYQHIEDDDLFFAFTSKTKEWRITKKSSIGKKTSYCNFKAFFPPSRCFAGFRIRITGYLI